MSMFGQLGAASALGPVMSSESKSSNDPQLRSEDFRRNWRFHVLHFGGPGGAVAG